MKKKISKNEFIHVMQVRQNLLLSVNILFVTAQTRILDFKMKNPAQTLWNDEAGFIVSIELILIATIAIIGLITGMTAVRDAVVSELSDVAGAVQDLNQCYSFDGVSGHSASTCGSDYIDATDWCDDADDTAIVADNCIVFTDAPENEL